MAFLVKGISDFFYERGSCKIEQGGRYLAKIEFPIILEFLSPFFYEFFWPNYFSEIFYPNVSHLSEGQYRGMSWNRDKIWIGGFWINSKSFIVNLQFNFKTLGSLRTTWPLSKVVEITPSSINGFISNAYKDFNLASPYAAPIRPIHVFFIQILHISSKVFK